MTFRPAIDFGPSNTVAALAAPGGTVRPLLFDGSPRPPSAVLAADGAAPLVGADAVRTQESFTSGSCTWTGIMTMRLGGGHLELTHQPDGAAFAATATLAR